MQDIEKVRQQAVQLVDSCMIATFNTITLDGFPRCVHVIKIANEGINAIYFGTRQNAEKLKHVQTNPKASMTFNTGRNACQLFGSVEVFTDDDTRRKYWVDRALDKFKGGPTDPLYCVVKFSVEKANYAINEFFIRGDIL